MVSVCAFLLSRPSIWKYATKNPVHVPTTPYWSDHTVNATPHWYPMRNVTASYWYGRNTSAASKAVSEPEENWVSWNEADPYSFGQNTNVMYEAATMHAEDYTTNNLVWNDTESHEYDK